jgi:hypothetical protein
MDKARHQALRPPRRLPRYSLRTLLVVFTLLCIAMFLWGKYVEPYRRQRQLADYFEQMGAEVTLEAAGPEWLRRMVGSRNVSVATSIILSIDDESAGNAVVSRRSLSTHEVRLLASAVHLRTLELGRCEITDTDLSKLRGLKSLETLDLAYTPVTDAGMSHLAAFPKLRNLRLQGTSVSDAGMAPLQTLSQLECVVLNGTHVTPRGVGVVAQGEKPPLVQCLQVRLDWPRQDSTVQEPVIPSPASGTPDYQLIATVANYGEKSYWGCCLREYVQENLVATDTGVVRAKMRTEIGSEAEVVHFAAGESRSFLSGSRPLRNLRSMRFGMKEIASHAKLPFRRAYPVFSKDELAWLEEVARYDLRPGPP